MKLPKEIIDEILYDIFRNEEYDVQRHEDELESEATVKKILLKHLGPYLSLPKEEPTQEQKEIEKVYENETGESAWWYDEYDGNERRYYNQYVRWLENKLSKK